MKKYLVIIALIAVSCAKKSPVYESGSVIMSSDEVEISKNRSKNLNIQERHQIEDWIKAQSQNYYPMGMNYWVDKENLDKNHKKVDGDKVSYEYDIYDFDMVKLYDKPKVNKDAVLGRFDELRPIEDALRYLDKNQSVTLLLPSILAFGTYGDNHKISNDMPLIIKLRTF
ncbi:FKBP-type peptidyl-prolyl cis-trans isomerase [Chryseobacterium sp. T1]